MKITIERRAAENGEIRSIAYLPPEILKRLERPALNIVASSPNTVRAFSEEYGFLLGIREALNGKIVFGDDCLDPWNDPTWISGPRAFHCTFTDSER